MSNQQTQQSALTEKKVYANSLVKLVKEVEDLLYAVGVEPAEYAAGLKATFLANSKLYEDALKHPQHFSLAIRQCASAGLLPDGKEAALVPFKSKLSFMPMVGGYLRIAARLGLKVKHGIVRAGDNFSVKVLTHATDDNPDMDDVVVHEQNYFSQDGKRDIIGAWAWVKDGNQPAMARVFTMEEINQARAASAAGKDGPWVTWPQRMAEKTVIKSLLKFYLPKVNPIEGRGVERTKSVKQQISTIIEADDEALGVTAVLPPVDILPVKPELAAVPQKTLPVVEEATDSADKKSNTNTEGVPF